MICWVDTHSQRQIFNASMGTTCTRNPFHCRLSPLLHRLLPLFAVHLNRPFCLPFLATSMRVLQGCPLMAMLFSKMTSFAHVNIAEAHTLSSVVCIGS